MNRLKKLVIVISIIMIFSGCQHEQTEDIFILYTNDVASAVNNGVSYAGVKGYYDRMKSDNRYVSLVDAGDFYDGDLAEYSDGDYITMIMNEIGYEFVAVGNQEFSIGIDELARNIRDAKFTFLSCNIRYVGSKKDRLKKIEPYVIKRFGPVRVAFIGVTTPETLIEGKTSYTQLLEDGVPAYDFYGGDDGQELYKQVQKTVDKVRKKAEYVIVLSHLGSNSVTEGFSSYDLIANTTGIDVVIDAHSHTVISGEAVDNRDGEMVVLTSTGKELENLGVLCLHPDHTFTTVLYPYVDDIDPALKRLCDSMLESIN